MLRSEKVATPLTAVTVFVPESSALLGFVPSATLIVPLKLGTGVPAASRAVTCTAGEITPLTRASLGWTVNASCVAVVGGGGAAAGLSTSAVASQVLGELKYQVHCGSSEPVLAGTV